MLRVSGKNILGEIFDFNIYEFAALTIASAFKHVIFSLHKIMFGNTYDCGTTDADCFDNIILSIALHKFSVKSM